MGTNRAFLLSLAISASFLPAIFAQRLASAQAAQFGPSLSSSQLQAFPSQFPGKFPGDIQGFQFPSNIDFGNVMCFKPRTIGSCVAPSRCRSSDDTGSGRCNTGQLCCEFKDMKPATTTPGGSGTSQQLVTNCGKPTPSRIFFQERVPAGSDLAFSKFPGGAAAAGGLSTLRERRSASRPGGGLGGITQLPLPHHTPEVVGGTDVEVTRSLPVGRWPWMALLGITESGTLKWKCGGTLISDTVVLTAAHCVPGLQPGELTVRLGEYRIGTSLDGRHTDTSVSRIVRHPDYHASQNDIALLVLTEPVVFSERIRPACLPPKDADHAGSTVSLAGWGRLEFAGSTADTLQEVDVVVVKDTECEISYRRSNSFERNFPGGFQGTKICANGADGTSRDACQGDSGGPLVAKGADDRYQVIGVVSTGLGCGNPAFPGVYTKVSKYIPWIISNS